MSDQKKLSAREYLKQLEVLDMQINDDIATLSDMKMNVCSAGGIDYSRDKVQTSPVTLALSFFLTVLYLFSIGLK